ncbi:hypothetical protein [Streptomyces mirabilis]|uniref:hypothetical protein n=1 Tax=Streptomyces mirabilis TaxID=68239 RepID=UPI00369BF639
MDGQRTTPSDAGKFMEILRAENDGIIADLGSVLDLESGLREILLRSDHSKQVAHLNAVLDVENGLAAILPSRTQGFWSASAALSLHETESDLGGPLAVPPHVRMVLRKDFAEHCDALELSEQLFAHFSHVASLADNIGDLLFASGAVDFSAAMEMCLRLSGEVGKMSPLSDSMMRAITETSEFAAELTAICCAAIDARRTLESARRFPHRSAKNSSGMTGRDLQKILAATHDDARQICHVVIDRALTGYRAAHRYLCEQSNVTRRALGHRLGDLNFPALTAAELRAFVDDFMYADLRPADLLGVDMTGVRWSTQTLWPAELDVEELRNHSVEDPAGSGIFVVRSGTARMRQFAVL